MVQGWYQGGVSVFDFTDSAHPVEIAFFDRGPIDATHLITAGFWSAYWYNGHVYGGEIARGLDVFSLTPSQYLTKNEIDAAAQVHSTEFNAQQQPRITWPSNAVVARAYLDQLTRDKAISPERAAAVNAALDRSSGARSAKGNAAAPASDQLASELERDASSASSRDSARLRALAAALKERPAGAR
jgi:hypothetical protein